MKCPMEDEIKKEEDMKTFKIGRRVEAEATSVGKRGRDNNDGGHGTIIDESLWFDWRVKLDSMEDGRAWGYNESELILLEEFKVGRRVKVKKEYVGAQHREISKDGGCGVIRNISPGPIPIHVDLENGSDWYYEEYELILKEDTMEIVNGYRSLNDITLRAVLDKGPCSEDWNDFVKHIVVSDYEWGEAIDLKDCIGIHDSWDAWFVFRGFVEEAGDEEFKVKTGDEFEIIDHKVMLCQVNSTIGFVILISPSVAGEFIDSTLYSVADTSNITQEEFKALCHGANWKEVYATRVPNKKE